ncbi:Acetyl xylan esterase (AXE1) [Maioricimonas rarisocia]|uniref:Acetyl xylan esterase (AXE1) n=1 Tax=Maioricimonas rarisocia TaxID=2528026 RepID=A0A517Z788_9PLAN|nr:acetylxylan esterase [Maioricimonas rarisocia]QDU38301.1 Acetyl xylan esterase (AXE1) [Maioricimonas rarisocia]
MLREFLVLFVCCGCLVTGDARADETEQVAKWLSERIIDPQLPLEEVRNFTVSRVPLLPELASREDWEQHADRMRKDAFEKVIFRGEAARWRELPTQVEFLGEIETDDGYRIRKLRYEAVPGMWIPALLYEPDELAGKVPVILNVNGHDRNGMVADYKQVRCINQVKRGMIALNVEWVGMGQLRSEGFSHYRMNQLDLCGTSGLAPFYLSLSRGIDVLLQHENADPQRVAVTGLSGGGCQTILISAFDERVTLANPVAGYSSFVTRGQYLSDLGDSEQTPSDLASVTDYALMTAMRAPRPTLLTYNDRDQCCFAAGHALPPLLAAARPTFGLYGASENLTAHVNHVPGSHNYLQDNREAFYRMVGRHFFAGQPFDWREIDVTEELRTGDELHVPLPQTIADFHSIAVELARDLPRTMTAASEAELSDENRAALRKRLGEVIRSRSPEVREIQELTASSHELNGEPVEVSQWRIHIGDEWTVPATVLTPAESDGTTIVLCDEGRAAVAGPVAQLLRERRTVVAVDPFYFGESTIPSRDFLYALLVACVGERPLGIQTDQIIAIAQWLEQNSTSAPVEVLAVGRRTGLIASTAAALEPKAIGNTELYDPLESLSQVIEENLPVTAAPELFCFGLLQEFDVPLLTRMVAPRAVETHHSEADPEPAEAQ